MNETGKHITAIVRSYHVTWVVTELYGMAMREELRVTRDNAPAAGRELVRRYGIIGSEMFLHYERHDFRLRRGRIGSEVAKASCW